MEFIVSLAKRPFTMLLLILMLSILFAVSIFNSANLETDLTEYMPKTHPAFIASDEAEHLFGIGDAILIVLEDTQGIYRKETIEKIDALTNALEQDFDAVKQVISLTTADNIQSSSGFLEVEPFFSGNTSEQALLDLKADVEANPMIYGRNVSRDGTATLIIAELVENADTQTLQKELQAWIGQWEGPQKLRIAGRPVIEGSLAELGPKDMSIMFPLVILTMIILLYFLLRSVRDTILNMVIVLFGTLLAFGSMTLLGVPIYAVDTMIPVMLIAIGVAYGIHMHNTIHHLTVENPAIGKDNLARSTLRQMIRPIFMTALTTAIGFLALMSSQVLPVRYFGLFAAIGVLGEMVLALLLFPASIYLLGIPKYKQKIQNLSKPSAISRLNTLIMDRPKFLVILSMIILAVGIWGTSKVWIDTSFLANFEKDSAIVETDEYVNTKFGGTSTLNVILTSETEDIFKNPQVLQTMDRMQAELESNPIVGNSLSLATFIKQMNQVMEEHAKDSYSIPDSQELISQYLLLYEFSGDSETLEQVIDYTYATANITIQLKSDSSAVLKEVLATVDSYRPAFREFDIEVGYAGSGYKTFVFSELLLEGQIISLIISFGIIFALLALLFHNVRIGIAGTVPIAITAIVNFGVMGLLNIPLSSATALITSIAVGIGVDYAIHFLDHYTLTRLEGKSLEEATMETLVYTGRAIVFNAIAVMGGFAILLFSVFPPNRQVGALIILNMATSAIATLTVLVVLIHRLDRSNHLFSKHINKNPMRSIT
ncbi:MAG: MMPL family transporter [Sphaerochaeta sp.]|nr:MMPL family transporter [Sphaerochaeta sp.]